MINRNTARGVFLIVLALGFGLQSLRYAMGRIDAAGPGMFPFLISVLLFLIGVATVIQARFAEKTALRLDPKNIAIILGSLVIFAIISECPFGKSLSLWNHL